MPVLGRGLVALPLIALTAAGLDDQDHALKYAFGLLLAVIVISLVWAFVDGVRPARPLWAVGVIWVVVGVLISLAGAVILAVGQPGLDIDDVAQMLYFGVVLIVVPALVGGAVGRLLRRAVDAVRPRRTVVAAAQDSTRFEEQLPS